MPSKLDIEVWKGNTLSRTFRLKAEGGSLVDLNGSVFVFRVVNKAAEIIRYVSASADELSVPTPENGEVVLLMPVADTRLLPDGAVARYELERRVGTEQTTVLYGSLVVKGWANDDV